MTRKKVLIFSSLLLVVGLAAGSIGFASFVEHSSATEFCISCHEMRSTVYEEYRKTIHYKNPAGVRVSCSDCHVPRTWSEIIPRKIMAVRDVYHHLLGTVDTPEKFAAERRHLAERVWARMKANNSLECRNCHNFQAMDLDGQRLRAQKQHQNAMTQGMTCIDCHKGIAHQAAHVVQTKQDQGDMSLEF